MQSVSVCSVCIEDFSWHTSFSNATPTRPRLEVTSIRRYKDLNAIELVVIAANIGLIQGYIIDGPVIIDVNMMRC